MLAGALVLPTTPLLIPGVSANPPLGYDAVEDAVDEACERAPAHDVVVLVASGAYGAVYAAARVDLAGIGRPDIVLQASVPEGLSGALAAATGHPLVRAARLPIGLGVLAVLVGGDRPVVPIQVPAAPFEVLESIGAALAQACADEQAAILVAASGDLSAGLNDRAPLQEVPGAAAFDERAVEAVRSGRLDDLAALGPDEAERVGARGWAPLAVLHGVLAGSGCQLAVRHYSAPRGVGYVVAHGPAEAVGGREEPVRGAEGEEPGRSGEAADTRGGAVGEAPGRDAQDAASA